MARTLRIDLRTAGDPVLERVAALLEREITSRCGAAVIAGAAAEAAIELAIEPGMAAESFCIAAEKSIIRISGADARGVLYGVGKFLRTSGYTPEGLLPSSWRGSSVPQKPVRGIYFASHFHNYYHEAPEADIVRYVEQLALWGTNVLAVWFDMHHFCGMQDPAAQAMLERLRIILRAAKEIGIGTGLVTIGNEGYANSPVELRADWTAGHDGYHHPPGGHYHVELCPSKPGAIDLMLRTQAERLDAFADIGIDYVWIWPYDQGGCTCSECKPWGVNGFLRVAEPLARLIRAKSPDTKIILSTWYFDHFTDGEWEGIDKAFATRPDWTDYLLADDNDDEFPAYPLANGVPGDLPMVNFPEISMYRMGPWGGYGANPFPDHMQSLWDQAKTALSGGFPYSEGIFDDINKAICAQFYWNEAQDAWDTVREYATYEYGPEAADVVCELIKLLEGTHAREMQGDESVPPENWRFVIERPAGAGTAWELARQADALLPADARTAWRWRILYLRALIDHELVTHDMAVSATCEAAFEELTAIYHAQTAALWVAPPTQEAIRANRQA